MENLSNVPHDQLFSAIIIGDSAVGKTSLMMRFAEEKFKIKDYNPTIGIDFKSKKIKVDGKVIKMKIWDTVAQERFRIICQTYYK